MSCNIIIDPYQYKDKHVVYLLNIENNIYKYGWSSDFIERSDAHRTKRGWTNYIQIFDCKTKDNARVVEIKFKKYLVFNKLLINYVDKNNINYIEIFQTDININEFISVINKYIQDEIDKSNKKYIEYYEKEKELKLLDIKLVELNIINENNDKNKLTLLENKVNSLESKLDTIINLLTNNTNINLINKNKIIDIDDNNYIDNEKNEIINIEINELNNNINNEQDEIIDNEQDEIINNEQDEIINNNIENNKIFRKCSKCKKEKEQNEEYFRLKLNNTYTLNCIDCLEKDKIRTGKNREQRNENNKKYIEAQKDKIASSLIPLHKCNRCSKVLEINETNFEKNDENIYKKICISCNIIIDNNRDEINRKQREYALKSGCDKKNYEKNITQKLEYKKKHYEENIDKFCEKNKEYYSNNKETILENKKISYIASKLDTQDL
jgi:predicted GIY-YIG superfamily endonuclease